MGRILDCEFDMGVKFKFDMRCQLGLQRISGMLRMRVDVEE